MSHDERLQTLRAQVEQLQAILQQAEQTLEQVRERLQSLETERRQYREALLSALGDDPIEFTEEELRDLTENGVTWEVIEQDLKGILTPEGR